MTLAVAFTDGFDHYPVSGAAGTELGILQAWQAQGGGDPIVPTFATGYKGRGKRLELTPGLTTDARLLRTVPSCTQVSMHIASSITHFDLTAVRGWITFRDAVNAEVFGIRTLPTGQLGLYNGASLLAQTAPISPQVAHRYNLAVDITNPASCDVQLWVDGDPAKGFHVSATDVTASNGPIIMLGLEQWGYGAGADGGNDHGFDDCVFCYGAAQNIGELEIITSGPTTDVRKQWTPLTGTNNYAMVDEIPPNGDTDYNSSTVVGNIDLQGFPALPTAPDSIFCVSQIFGAKKEESGTRGFAPVMTGTGADHVATTQNLSTSYDWYYQHYLTNPDTAAAWLAAARTAAGFGYKDAL
jgi:hypothetical protein